MAPLNPLVAFRSWKRQLGSFANHVVDRSFYIIIFQHRVASSWRHQLHAVERVGMKRIDALCDTRCPCYLVAKLRRPQHAGAMASYAGRCENLFALGQIRGAGRHRSG